MSYKTILVHLNDERRVGQLIDVAGHIADQNEAHLIGLYVVPSMVVGSFSGLGGRLAQSGRQAFKEEAKRIETAFYEAMKGRAVVGEWRLLEPPRDHPGTAEAVLEQARSVDLVVASQTDSEWEYSLLLDFPDRLALESGRPTLIVPHAGRFPRVGQRALVAWNGKREATRAVFDALPLLEKADAVRILWVNPGHRSANTMGRTPGEDLAATLARHGVKCELSSSVTSGIEVGDDLLSRLSDFGADLLVMGCYGHSRLREFVMGGATREILNHMTVPVLMSH
jgi:nucleotide-binding universal stress UspA family protein